MIQQDRNFRNIDGLSLEVVDVQLQHFQQSVIITHIGRRAMGEEGKAKGINGKMPFNPVGRFVETKSFRLDTGVTRILHCLRVNDDQSSPLGLFFTWARTC